MAYTTFTEKRRREKVYRREGDESKVDHEWHKRQKSTFPRWPRLEIEMTSRDGHLLLARLLLHLLSLSLSLAYLSSFLSLSLSLFLFPRCQDSWELTQKNSSRSETRRRRRRRRRLLSLLLLLPSSPPFQRCEFYNIPVIRTEMIISGVSRNVFVLLSLQDNIELIERETLISSNNVNVNVHE